MAIHKIVPFVETGGMGQLFSMYKQVLPALDGYLIETNGHINIKRFKVLCQRLSANEMESFILQYQFLKQYHEKINNNKKYSYFPKTNIEKNNQLKQMGIDELDNEILLLRDTTNIKTRESFKDRYYNSRWGDDKTKCDRKQICIDYIRSLQWVLNYYYQGCCSWSYYYPHHYAPLISGMELLNEDDTDDIYTFDLNEPYKPFQQLLAVLPIKSRKILPKKYQNLMIDSNSPISKYYPNDFVVDMNLSISSWEGIAILPFIIEKDLKLAIDTLENGKMDEKHCDDNDSKMDKDENNNIGYINSHKQAITFKYDYKKSLKKNRIKGPIGFGPMVVDVKCLKYKFFLSCAFIVRLVHFQIVLLMVYFVLCIYCSYCAISDCSVQFAR